MWGLVVLGLGLVWGCYSTVPGLADFVCLGFRMLLSYFVGLGTVGCCGLVSLAGCLLCSLGFVVFG